MSNYIEENSELIMLRSMANVFMPEALDPVGQEDDDVDNDGDSDKSDAYLKKRRKAVGAAIAADRSKRKIKEDLEQELQEKVLYKSEKPVASSEKRVEIAEKPVTNKITVNPEMKESVSSRIKALYEKKYVDEGMKQARKNVGASTCWDGYTAKGTKKKDGKEVPNCVKEWDEVESVDEGLSGERYKKALKKGKMYSRMVSKDPSKRAKRGGRGGESDFGAGDRGSGNKAKRRSGKSVDDSRYEY